MRQGYHAVISNQKVGSGAQIPIRIDMSDRLDHTPHTIDRVSLLLKPMRAIHEGVSLAFLPRLWWDSAHYPSILPM